MEQILIAAISLIVGWFFKSYFTEKAKNLATKEDIAEITRKVESVKNEVKLIGENQIQYQLQRREALLRFFDTTTILVLDKLTRSVDDFKKDGGKGLSEHLKSVASYLTALATNYHRLLLYTEENDHTIQAAGDVLKASVNLRTVYERHFLKAALATESLVNSLPKDSLPNEHFQTLEEYTKVVVPKLLELKLAYNNYLAALNDQFRRLGRSTALESLQTNTTGRSV